MSIKISGYLDFGLRERDFDTNIVYKKAALLRLLCPATSFTNDVACPLYAGFCSATRLREPGDDHLSGVAVTRLPRCGGVCGATEPSLLALYRCKASGTGDSTHPNPPCTTMSLPIMHTRVLHDPRYSEAFHSPLKGVVSVALVLHRLYRICDDATAVSRMAFFTHRSSEERRRAIGVRTFLPRRSSKAKPGRSSKEQDKQYRHA